MHRRKMRLGVIVVLAITLSAVATMLSASTQQAATERELAIVLAVSGPPNGTHFVAGQAPVVTITLRDNAGAPFAKDDFATLNLYMYGPQEPPRTRTALRLLNATGDRSQTPHHYIDLLRNPDVRVNGNVLTYRLRPVSDEEPGTYTVALYAVQKEAPLQQTMELVDLQISTATVEQQVVDQSKCAACHRGAASGKFYLHHIDPYRSPTGSWALDFVPVRTCKACHNTDGYAAYLGDINAPTTEEPVARTPDPIVRRVHGVHRGRHLETTFNIDPVAGDFAEYTHIEFPADVRNCTFCHVDDRFKTLPSRMACGACHDSTWFSDVAGMPADRKAHPGGPQADDSRCSACHPPDSGGVKAVAEAHRVPPPAFKHTVELAMSAPANGQFYVAGEKPTVTITVKDAATGNPINPNTMFEPDDATRVRSDEWRRAYLFVSGPRSDTRPVLTTAVGDPTKTYASNDLRVLNDASKADPRITRSDTSIVYQLADVQGLAPGTYSAWVETMPAAPLGGWALVNFQVGTATPQNKVATNCMQCHGDTRMHAGYFAVQFEPDICKSCHDYQRQIPGKSGWTNSNNGFGAAPLARRVHGVHFGRYLDKPREVHEHDYSHVIFPQDVRNCTTCHTETTSWSEKPSRVACLSCHDRDAAQAHGELETVDRTPDEPFSGQETEACAVCHGKDRAFSPDKVHNISDPYKPPYPRERQR